ncbi:MAG: hypothetical protein ACLFUB_19190 [Cyclobacteriaceae bacterium]
MKKTVAVSALDPAVQEKFNINNSQLEDLVVFVHDTPEANVPQTVPSLPEVPARVTVPISCGKASQIE